MNRIDSVFENLKKRKEKALVGFVTAGDPDVPRSLRVIEAMWRGGLDVLELGVPFSDPTADGPVIQRSSQRALKSGVTLRKVIEMVKNIRKFSEIPVIIFSYYNPIIAYGSEKFYNDATDAGVDGVLIVDLPPEESKDLLSSLPGWGSRWVELYHCVAFPDALKLTTEVAPDSPPEIIVDVEDRNNLEKRLEEIFEYWRGREKTRICDYPQLINQLREMLSCDYELDNPLYFEALEEEKKIINLTEQQFDILSMMCKNRKASIGGCAGSGKTLLAAEKALRLSKQGMRTLLTCYNKGLGNHLAQVLKDRENLEVVHFHHLCHTYAEKAGVELSKTYDSNFFEYELPEAFCKALEKEPSLKFDAVIVDEGQDFKEVWWLALMESLKSPEDGIFYIFYDNNQNIYHGVENIFSNFASLSLNHNLRNTKCIFKLIRQFYDSDTPVECRAPMGRPVEIVSYSGQQGMKKKLGGIIHKLIVEERFHPGDLSVLCMRSIAPDGYANVHEGDRIGNFILKQEPENQNDIQLSTVYSFKGLENRVVIITDIDNYYLGNIERYKNLFYVGFSRARNHLVLLCEEGAGELIEKFR